MKVTVNFCDQQYEIKPENVAQVQNQLTVPIDVEVSELANKLVHGRNIRPAAMHGKSDNDFEQQQLFMIDFDNQDRRGNPFPPDKIVTPDKAKEMAARAGLKPCFAYFTFSHTAELPKFRMAFLLNRSITDLTQRDHIQTVIMDAFTGLIDSSCSNASRIFFGSQSGCLIFSDFEALNDADELLQRIHHKPMKTTKVRGGSPVHIAKKSTLNGNITAIRNRDATTLRKSLGITEKTTFDNRQDFFNFLYNEISLSELLEVEQGKPFCCIFHDNTHPSASIFKGDFGKWFYKCHGACNMRLNLKQLIEALGDFDSESKALSFIKDVYDLEIKETDWSREQIENIDSILFAIRTRGEESQCGNIIFFMSTKYLMRQSGASKEDTVRAYLKMFTYHGMLHTLSDEQVPKHLLARALQQRKNENYKRVSFYSIPSWVF